MKSQEVNSPSSGKMVNAHKISYRTLASPKNVGIVKTLFIYKEGMWNYLI